MFTFTQWIDLLLKGHGHKYIKRIPYNTPKGRRYRYIYNVTHSHRGKHAMDESHLVEGTKFMVHTESGKEVHAHITSVNGNNVTYVLDDGADKGKSVTASKSEIVSMLNEKHNVNEQVQAKRDKLNADIEQARKTGTEKQVARLQSQLERLGGEKPAEAIDVADSLLTIGLLLSDLAGARTKEKEQKRKKLSALLPKVSEQLLRDVQGIREKQRSFSSMSTDEQMKTSKEVTRLNNQIESFYARVSRAEKHIDTKVIKPILAELQQKKKFIVNLQNKLQSEAKSKLESEAKPAKTTKPAKPKKQSKPSAYEKSFKEAPPALAESQFADKIYEVNYDDMFTDPIEGVSATGFLESVVEKAKLKPPKTNIHEYEDLIEHYEDFVVYNRRQNNPFHEAMQNAENPFDVTRFVSNHELFDTKAKKIKQGTVVEYPFAELHKKGLGFGFITDSKTGKTGLGFFVKRGMFAGNAFIMSPCVKNEALSHLSTILNKLDHGMGTLDAKRPFKFLRDVEQFGSLSDQLKQISLIVDDNGLGDAHEYEDRGDQDLRQSLIEDYGEEWVADTANMANNANAGLSHLGADYDEQVGNMLAEQGEAEELFDFAKKMSVVSPKYGHLKDKLEDTKDGRSHKKIIKEYTNEAVKQLKLL